MSVPEIENVLHEGMIATSVMQIGGFLYGYTYETEKGYDVIGALNSITLLGLAYYIPTIVRRLKKNKVDVTDPRKLAIAILFAASRIYLFIFLAWRTVYRSGDARLQPFIGDFVKFGAIWLLQGVWVYAVAYPMIVVTAAPRTVPMGLRDWILVGMGFFGLNLQIIADIQKATWVNAGRPGGFCGSGVWSMSRHPNYFGEMLMWWSGWGLCLGMRHVKPALKYPTYVWRSLCSPLVTMFVLLFVTGMPITEGEGLRRFEGIPAYWKYRDHTSPFIPMPPGIWTRLPSFLQVSLGELAMYALPAAAKVPLA